MSKNIDIVAVCMLLLAAALFGGIRDVLLTLHRPGGLVRIERNGNKVFVTPMPALPRVPRIPHLERD